MRLIRPLAAFDRRGIADSLCRSVAAVAVVTCVSGCDPGTYVHLERASRPDSVVFHVYERADSLNAAEMLRSIEVQRCSSGLSIMWDIERVPGDTSRNRQRFIRYGQLPDGQWQVHQPRTPLTQGCYIVSAEGVGLRGSYRFIVEGDSVTASYSER